MGIQSRPRAKSDRQDSASAPIISVMTWRLGRRALFAVLSVACFVLSAQAAPGPPLSATGSKDAGAAPATYSVSVQQLSPPRLAVTARVPVKGNVLQMETTRPGDIPEILKKGWPALIRRLKVSDESGRSIEVAGTGPAGWELKGMHEGSLSVAYEVDYSTPAALGWPAPRETAFADSEHIVFVGRSVFVTTPEVRSSHVTFSLPPGWSAVTPWSAAGGSKREFVIDSLEELVENLIVLSRPRPERVTAGGFRVFVTPMGHWRAATREIDRILRGVMPRFVKLMGFRENRGYSIILLPILEKGGESFRGSFAMTTDVPPSRMNRSSWGRTIAHEIFHYWNGWRMTGSDYASSQWFQEGFTDYAADWAMVSSGLIAPGGFLGRLADHIRNYRELTTALAAPGGRKGPPLYSGGALVAFCWDVQIRRATGGAKTIGDFLRALWRETDGGRRTYAWKDVQAALAQTAPLDWNAFFRAYIQGIEKIPLDEIFSEAGLRIATRADGFPVVERDPVTPETAKPLWRRIVAGR